MADTKISALTELTSASAGEVLPIVSGGATKKIKTENLFPPVVFTAPTLLNSWVNFGAGYANAGYTRHLGLVMVRGTVKNGTLNSVVFTLPSGYRPSAALIFAVNSNAAHGVIEIGTNGDVIQRSGSNVSLAMDQIHFPPV